MFYHVCLIRHMQLTTGFKGLLYLRSHERCQWPNNGRGFWRRGQGNWVMEPINRIVKNFEQRNTSRSRKFLWIDGFLSDNNQWGQRRFNIWWTNLSILYGCCLDLQPGIIIVNSFFITATMREDVLLKSTLYNRTFLSQAVV